MAETVLMHKSHELHMSQNCSSLDFLKSQTFQVARDRSAEVRRNRKVFEVMDCGHVWEYGGSEVFQSMRQVIFVLGTENIFQVHSVNVCGGSVEQDSSLGCLVLSLLFCCCCRGQGLRRGMTMATTTTAAREATDDGGSVVHRDVWSLGVLGCLFVSLCCCRLLWLLLWSGSGLLREMTTATTTTTTACGDNADDDNDKQAATTAGLGEMFQVHSWAVIFFKCIQGPDICSRAGEPVQLFFQVHTVDVCGGSAEQDSSFGVSCFVVVDLLLRSGSGSPTRDDDGDDNDGGMGGDRRRRIGGSQGRPVSGCLGMSACFAWLLSFVGVVVVVGIGTPAGEDDCDDHDDGVRRRQRRRQRQTSSDDSRARTPLD